MEDHDTPAEVEPKKQRLIARLARRIWIRAYYRFPTYVPTPFPEDREYFRNKDNEDNKKTMLPEGDALRCLAFWVSEFYGPTEINGLYLALEELGWSSGKLDPIICPVEWVKNHREYGGFSYYDIGVVVGKQSVNATNRFSAELPLECSHLLVRVYQITSSLTCVSIGFVLDGPARDRYQTILQNPQSTHWRRDKELGRFRHYSVENAKEADIDSARTEITGRITAWISRNLPGSFCRRNLTEEIPILELLSTTENDISNDFEALREDPSMWRSMVARTGFSVWASKKHARLKITTKENIRRGRPHMIATVVESSITDGDLGIYSQGEHPQRLIPYFLHLILPPFCHFSVLAFLSDMRADLIRQGQELVNRKRSRRDLRRILTKIQSNFEKNLGRSSILSSISRTYSCRKALRFFEAEYTEQPIGADSSEEPADFQETFVNAIFRTAEETAHVEVETRSQLEQYTNITSTKESIFSQKRMETLTIVTVLLSGIAVGGTLYGIFRPDPAPDAGKASVSDQVSNTFPSAEEKTRNGTDEGTTEKK